MMFSLVDSLHRVLKTTLSVSGSDLPTALLEHVRTNDEVQSCESFQEFLDVMGESCDLYLNHVMTYPGIVNILYIFALSCRVAGCY